VLRALTALHAVTASLAVTALRTVTASLAVTAMLAVTGVVFLAPAAFAQTQPGASPGAVLPELPEPRLEPKLEGPAAAFPIPPSVERPLDVEEGDRLFVKTFKLKGVTDRPAAGIDASELQKILEDLRIERQGLNKVDDDGFTEPERAQIADFMRKVVDDPDLEMNFEEYEALVDQLRAIKAERDAGMTIGQMQQIAATVTEYYRSAGFILAQAYIPAQEVTDGVVEIEVLEGTLGNVLAENNQRYEYELLAKPFKDLIDAPVTADNVETAILRAGDYPGMTLFGVFQPGRTVGSSDLVLRVQEEDPFEGSVRLDNHGTRFTGERRALVDVNFNNLPFTNAGDRAGFTVLRQFKPQNAFFGEARYERPFVFDGSTVGGSFARNPFDVGAELRPANLSGESTVAKLFYRQSLIRSRQQNLWGTLGWKRSNEKTKQGRVEITEDNLSMLTGEFAYDNIDAESQAINQARFGGALGLGPHLGGNDRGRVENQITRGGRQGGTGKFASNDFYKLTASYTRLQILDETQSLLMRVEGQWTNKLLTSLEQYSIGGPNSVRAFPVSEFQVDTGLFASAEWTVNAPFFADKQFSEAYTWGQVLRMSFFADWAYGEVNDAAASEQATIHASGFGTALSFSLPGKFTARLEFAHPFGGDKPSDGDVSQYWLDLTYQF
jgi:hemolysin activation/secretion protein